MSNKNFSFVEESSSDTVSNQDLNYQYELSDNVVEDLIDYTRSETVKNEQQFVLTFLSYLSGYMDSPKHYISSVLIGTAGSGKSHIQNTVADLFDDSYLYNITSGSEKSIIYDDDWGKARFANMDELNKPGEEIIELLKALHGGEDESFEYKVTGGGKGADRDTDTITKEAKPYCFLYAQYEPDFEMWDRLLKIPVHESSEKNDGVARTHWGHTMISFGGADTKYMYDFEDGKKALKDHIRNIPEDAYVDIPAGQDEFGGYSFYDEVKDIFDIDRSETNRVSKMVANLIRSSALLNHQKREKKKMKIKGEVKEVIIAEPQDLANIMACRDVLMATTHQLDRKRRAICLAIDEVGGTQSAAPIKHPDDKNSNPRSIMGYLRVTNASFVKRSQIEQMLADLQDNGLVEKMERAGENGRNLYKFTSWQDIGKFNIDSTFKELFDGTVDPFEEREFVETARQINDLLTPSASDFMSSNEVSSETENSQKTLGEDTSTGIDVDLTPTEEYIHSALKETVGGKTICGLDEHDPTAPELLGVIPIGETRDSADLDNTLLDPSHEAWQYGPDEWVETQQDCEREIEKMMKNLTEKGVFRTSIKESRGGTPLKMDVEVMEVQE